jgi:hypothetical protein
MINFFWYAVSVDGRMDVRLSSAWMVGRILFILYIHEYARIHPTSMLDEFEHFSFSD